MTLRQRILAAHPHEGQAAIFYLGQETVLIKCAGKYLLFDPYLTDYVDRNFATPETPWKRSYPAPIDPAELDFIDYVFCSHDHGDHCDPETLSVVAAASPQAVFLGSSAVCKSYVQLSGISAERTVCVRADEPAELSGGVIVTAIPAAHEELHPDGNGSYLELGFIVTLGGMRFYHAGDCCPYDGLIERLTNIDIGFLPINGRDWFRTSRNIIGNFDSAEAVMIAAQAGFSLLVPLHFGLYAINDASPAHFVSELNRLAPELPFHIFSPGEKLIWEK